MSSRNLLQDVSDYIDRHIREIKYFSYGLGVVGAVIILRSTYAFSKFRTVKDVPERFVKVHVKLHGTVEKVDCHGCLSVDHTPVISLEKFHSKGGGKGYLAVSLAGVNILAPGVSWLEQQLQNKHIWFKIIRVTPIHTRLHLSSTPRTTSGIFQEEQNDGDSLDCIVTARKGFLRNMCVNRELVRLGLATVEHIDGLHGDHDVIKLTTRLLQTEMKAERKGYGKWQRPPLYDRIMEPPRRLTEKLLGLFRWKAKTAQVRDKKDKDSKNVSERPTSREVSRDDPNRSDKTAEKGS